VSSVNDERRSMPYAKDHKAKTRARIVEAARKLFNQHGYQDVTIDMVMAAADLTRGGFYKHFSGKEELFAAAVRAFLMGRGAKWRADAGIDTTQLRPEMAGQMVQSYLSADHLGALQDQCPMIALPSDVARGNTEVKEAYQELLVAMVGLFEATLPPNPDGPARRKALSLAALCVGGMVLARTLPESTLAQDVRKAALASAQAMAV